MEGWGGGDKYRGGGSKRVPPFPLQPQLPVAGGDPVPGPVPKGRQRAELLLERVAIYTVHKAKQGGSEGGGERAALCGHLHLQGDGHEGPAEASNTGSTMAPSILMAVLDRRTKTLDELIMSGRGDDDCGWAMT